MIDMAALSGCKLLEYPTQVCPHRRLPVPLFEGEPYIHESWCGKPGGCVGPAYPPIYPGVRELIAGRNVTDFEPFIR